ncbi:MAG: metallophosphoesterase [Verrucomicrobia bacterium]|nr:metallophosphoesterase [Verrucomicrobiota bacterium]
MKIALFSDVHGRLRIMLRMLQCWQIQHQMFLDGALLAGDLGCFPDESRFDKATRRWIERDPEEAGFPKYFMRRKTEVETVFGGAPEHGEFATVKCPILFVAGNHECFDYLVGCERAGHARGAPKQTFPVDCYRKIHCIKNGAIVRVPGADGGSIRIAGLWGIENARNGSPKKISDVAARQIEAAGLNGFDILLTHDAPGHSYTGHAASGTISRILDTCRPPLHVFGHAHPVAGQHEFQKDPIPTHSWIFEDAGFGKKCNGSLEGAMGILTWDVTHSPQGWAAELVQDEWLKRMRHRTWQHVWPDPCRQASPKAHEDCSQ